MGMKRANFAIYLYWHIDNLCYNHLGTLTTEDGRFGRENPSPRKIFEVRTMCQVSWLYAT
jgi:hypothetical protein